MHKWGRGKFWAFYIDGLGLPIDEIAFANVAWCATQGDKYPHHHQANGDAFLFSFTDKIIQDKLGLYRERRGNVTH